jgi:hypothetical protein
MHHDGRKGPLLRRSCSKTHFWTQVLLKTQPEDQLRTKFRTQVLLGTSLRAQPGKKDDQDRVVKVLSSRRGRRPCMVRFDHGHSADSSWILIISRKRPSLRIPGSPLGRSEAARDRPPLESAATAQEKIFQAQLNTLNGVDTKLNILYMEYQCQAYQLLVDKPVTYTICLLASRNRFQDSAPVLASNHFLEYLLVRLALSSVISTIITKEQGSQTYRVLNRASSHTPSGIQPFHFQHLCGSC